MNAEPRGHSGLRVLFFDDRHYAAQGAQRVLTQIARFARDEGHEVTVASTRPGKLLTLAEERGLPTLVVGTPRELDQWGGLLTGRGASRARLIWALLRQNLRLARLIRRGRYDVVWAAAMRPMLSLLLTSLLPRPRVVWHVMSDAHFRGFNEVAGLAANRIVLLAQSLSPALGPRHSSSRMRRKTRVLPPGVDRPEPVGSTRADLAAALDLPNGASGRTWIAAIGGYVPEKGHLDLVNAVNSLPGAVQEELVVLVGGPPGDGEYDARVADAAAASKAEVVLHGWVDDANSWMRAADVFALPSRREGVPLVVVEAMQRRAVPICYRVGATPELIDHDRTGMLVDQGDVQAFARCLERLVASPELRDSLAEAASAHVEGHHTITSMRQTFSTLLADAAGRP